VNSKVLVYRFGSLGDTVIVLPAFHLVREAFPLASLSLLTNVPVNGKAAPVADILGSACPVEEVIAYPAGTRSMAELTGLVSSLRRRRFSHCVYVAKPKGGLANVCRDWALFKMAGIGKVIGMPWRREDRLCLPLPGNDSVEWDCARTMRCLRALGSPNLAEAKWWDLKLTAEERSRAETLLQGVSASPLVGFSIGTKASSKDWEDSNWIPFLREFSSRYPEFRGFFVGSADEHERCDRLMTLSGLHGINLCGQLSPRASAAALAKAQLFVGHDSGPMHLAACVGTPVVAIFSARNRAAEWFPRGGEETNRVIYHKTECAGCGLDICAVQAKKCILSITVDEVLQACDDLLSAKQGVN
jgi:heptosyltransferase III